MNLSRQHKIIIAIITLLIILVPTGSFLVSKAINKSPDTSNNLGQKNFPVSSPREVPKEDPFSKLKKDIEEATASSTPSTTQVQPPTSEGATLLLAPALSFKLILEGRPTTDQSAKVFLGVAGGQISNNPKYLLSFVINLPANGEYKDLNLAGLDQNVTYTAYLKGPAQIATSSTFIAKNSPLNLGTLQMLTGDVNDDNIINTLDTIIVKAALGSIAGSSKWNPNLDFNLDQRINALDLSLISKNINKVGASGAWISKPPETTLSATISGSIIPNVGGPDNTPHEGRGYWMWVPTEF